MRQTYRQSPHYFVKYYMLLRDCVNITVCSHGHKLLKRPTMHSFYKYHKSDTLLTSASPIYTRSSQHMQLSDRGHSYTLPTCSFKLYKTHLLTAASLN